MLFFASVVACAFRVLQMRGVSCSSSAPLHASTFALSPGRCATTTDRFALALYCTKRKRSELLSFTDAELFEYAQSVPGRRWIVAFGAK
jgi:hypothetical protein